MGRRSSLAAGARLNSMHPVLRLLLALSLLPFAVGQSNNDGAAQASSIYASSTSSPTASTSSTASPPPSNTKNTGDDDQGQTDMDGLVNYYFVFLALIVIVAALGAFFVYRRKRKAAMLYQHGQAGALQQDVGAWDPFRARRRYWQGRWRSTDVTHREEGLNEHGEAPPPYMPKETHDEEAGLPTRDNNSPAVPLQTLSRDQAGLKPPGYEYAMSDHPGRANATSSTSESSQHSPAMGSQSQQR